MGYSPDWQKQSYAKSNSAPKVTQKGNIISRPLFDHQPSRLSLADGGDVTEEQLKKEGLAISNAERESRQEGMTAGEKFKDGVSSLWERLKAGNIDDPKSEAYAKYGAGRARADRDAKREAAGVEAGMANRGDNTDEFASGRKAMMGDAASVARVSESNPTGKGVTDEPQKSKIYKAEPAEVKAYKPEPMPEPKPLKDRTTEAVRSRKPVTRDSSVAKDMKPASQSFPLTDNRDLPSKPYPVKSRPNEERPSKVTPDRSYTEADAQEAGARYAASWRALQNAPAETSDAARKALQQYVDDARADYEMKAKRVKKK